jgi:hypothetical protein
MGKFSLDQDKLTAISGKLTESIIFQGNIEIHLQF